jgi:CheY-like chemotaxis protein
MDTDQKQETVLVIEDDHACLRVMEAQLRRAGYHVLAAAAGAEGIELARSRDVDLITLDMRMRPLDGWAVFAALRADPTTRDIPVVLVTVVDEVIVGRTLGADGYVAKPFRARKLLEAVDRALHPTPATPTD